MSDRLSATFAECEVHLASGASTWATSGISEGQPPRVLRRGDSPWLSTEDDALQVATEHQSARRRRLADEQLSELVKRRAAGRTIEGLAQDFGCDPSTIAERLAKAKDRRITLPD